MLVDYTESDHEALPDRSWHHVDFGRRVYVCQQLFVQFVHLLICLVWSTHQPETY